jgi:hypothetical protein
LFQELKQWVGGEKRLMSEVFKLDGIVFNEIVLDSKDKLK